MEKALITWPNGNPRQSYPLAILQGQEGMVREYHRNGRLLALGKVRSMLQQGIWKYFHADGQRSAMGNFQDGLQRGEWIYYDEDREYRTVHWQAMQRPEFAICVPQGWQSMEREGHLLHWIRSASDPTSPWISVSLHSIDESLGIREFTLQLLTRSEKSLRAMDFKIQEMEPQLIRNLDACLALTTIRHQDAQLCTRMAFIKSGDQLFKIQAVCSLESYGEHKTLFEECLRSFLLKSPNAPCSGLQLIYPPDLAQEQDDEASATNKAVQGQ